MRSPHVGSTVESATAKAPQQYLLLHQAFKFHFSSFPPLLTAIMALSLKKLAKSFVVMGSKNLSLPKLQFSDLFLLFLSDDSH